jgi:hypothetical protein
MAFRHIYQAVYDQLDNDTILSSYVNLFKLSKKQNWPQQGHTIMLSPVSEQELDPTEDYDNIKHYNYGIGIYCLVNLNKELHQLDLGFTENGKTYKGSLEFVDDIKNAIRKALDDLIKRYNTAGYSESKSNESSTFNLAATNKFITVSINGNTPTGYDQINCGDSSLNGTIIASNIQESLRNLGIYDGDGYLDANVTFDSETNTFKIESGGDVGPKNYVNVTSGVSDDCSVILGFENPTEERGKNIIDYTFDTVILESEENYPVRVRLIPLFVTEEMYVGG